MGLAHVLSAKEEPVPVQAVANTAARIVPASLAVPQVEAERVVVVQVPPMEADVAPVQGVDAGVAVAAPAPDAGQVEKLQSEIDDLKSRLTRAEQEAATSQQMLE